MDRFVIQLEPVRREGGRADQEERVDPVRPGVTLQLPQDRPTRVTDLQLDPDPPDQEVDPN